MMGKTTGTRVVGSTREGVSRRAAPAGFTDGIEVVEHEDYGWAISGISRLFSLKKLGRYVDYTDATEARRALIPSRNQAARRLSGAVVRTIYAKEYLGFDSIARFYDHLRVDSKLRRAVDLGVDWLVDSRVVATAYSELHIMGALDVIDAQVKADPELAEFRQRGRVAHKPQTGRSGPANRRPGACEFCEREVTGRGIARHVRSCEERTSAARSADRDLALKPDYLIHVRVWSAGYWLELEVRASAPLRAVDEYIRDVWMDAVDDCGHLSGFDVHARFTRRRGGDDHVGDTLVGESLCVGARVVHTFDYGSSTYSNVESVGVRWGAPLSGARDVHLLARNLPVGGRGMNSPREGVC